MKDAKSKISINVIMTITCFILRTCIFDLIEPYFSSLSQIILYSAHSTHPKAIKWVFLSITSISHQNSLKISKLLKDIRPFLLEKCLAIGRKAKSFIYLFMEMIFELQKSGRGKWNQEFRFFAELVRFGLFTKEKERLERKICVLRNFVACLEEKKGFTFG